MTEERSKVFPEKEVRLLCGDVVVVRPWTLKNGRLLRKRVASLIETVRAASEEGKVFNSVDSLLEVCETDIIHIIAGSIGKDVDWMEEKFHYEELATVGKAVWDICLYRGENEGVAGKLMGLVSNLGGLGLAPNVSSLMQERMELVRKEALSTTTNSSAKDSPSSPEDGEAIPSISEAL